jgi:mannitol 2-dehydrogenase
VPIPVSLQQLPALATVAAVPRYRREDLSAGIAHLGVGNFHRAHQGMYLHRLMDLGLGADWAIVGAGVKAADLQMRQRLQGQDWLTTVVESDRAGTRVTITGAMVDFVSGERPRLLALLTQPQIRIVTLTITEGGYYIDANTGGFHSGHADFSRPPTDGMPTVFGLLVEALMQRRARGTPPFSVVSCDNLPANGHAARQALLGVAGLRDDDAQAWCAGHVACPAGMVDCITPAVGDPERQRVRQELGIDDAAPVLCEPFRQWVLEDRFTAGRPPLHEVGVAFVSDVAPFELMKLRLLNAAHAALAYPAALLGFQHVHDAVADPQLQTYVSHLVLSELLPTVPVIDGVSRVAYFRQAMLRFANPAIADTVARLCLDGSNRQPKFVLPALAERLEAGLPVDGLALELALWCRYCGGPMEDGSQPPLDDPKGSLLRERAQAARADATAWLDMPDVIGPLGQDPRLRLAFQRQLQRLWQDGTRATLARYLVDRAAVPAAP